MIRLLPNEILHMTRHANGWKRRPFPSKARMGPRCRERLVSREQDHFLRVFHVLSQHRRADGGIPTPYGKGPDGNACARRAVWSRPPPPLLRAPTLSSLSFAGHQGRAADFGHRPSLCRLLPRDRDSPVLSRTRVWRVRSPVWSPRPGVTDAGVPPRP